MTKTVNIETSLGTFVISKPKAGPRNRAVIKAETDSGKIKQSVMMMELLPQCVQKRPENIDQDTKIEHVLDGLEIEDYDALVMGLTSLLKDTEEESPEKKTESTTS